MKGKRIVNIVFYKFYDNDKEIRRACIFYNDGTVSDVNYEDGISACEEVVKAQHITSKEAFKEMINHDMIHVVSGKELERNFSRYIVKEEETEKEEEDDNLHSVSMPVPVVNLHDDSKNESGNDSTDAIDTTSEEKDDALGFVPIEGEPIDAAEEEEDIEDEDELAKTDNLASDSNDSTVEEDTPLDDDFLEDLDEDSRKRPLADDRTSDSDGASDDDFEDDDDLEDDFDDEIDEDIEDDVREEEKPKKERKGIVGFFQKQWEKLIKNKVVRRLVLCVTALAVGLGIYSCAAKNTKEGEMLNSNITNETSISDDKDGIFDGLKNLSLIRGNNDYYNNYSYGQLLEVTENSTQKTAMTNLGNTIQAYNGGFADAYIEEGKDIRAALSFDELVALQQAYNDYSKDEIKAYFNGAEVDAAEMEQDYKSASLQLMGAHVIETRENPVDMSSLLVSDEAKAFYEKYHEMFLDAKEAQGEDKLAKVSAFYKEVRADFPITQEVRTEGIMHADDYDSIESYKLSVTPMIAAAEMMFQNLNVDYTLDDSEIDFLNDIGLCNYAQDKFAKIETITLSSEEDNTNPLYSQYRDSIIGMMKDKEQYVIDDEHRDLSRLDAFQKGVNWHFENSGEASWVGGTYTTTETRQETKTWTETDTTYREEETRVEKEIPAEEKEKIDQQIEKENEEEKKKAEEEAEETRQDMQEEADKEAEKIEEEVKKDEEDMQDDIDDANQQIDENNSDDNPENDKPVNEDDFGDHNVDFDDEHSDSEGNLDDSVEDITTDPSGDQTGEELPDPNVTGEEFDNEYEEGSSSNSNSGSDNSGNEDTSTNEENTSGQEVYEYEEPVEDTSNEELVDAYIENMASDTSYQEEESYQYTR